MSEIFGPDADTAYDRLDDDPDADLDESGVDAAQAWDQLQPEDSLVDRGVDDVLDEGYSPPDHYRSIELFDRTHETIEDRIRQEVPDPDSAYGAPDNESGLDVERLGGDDPDAIDAEDDFLGGPEIGGRRAGRLVAPDEGLGPDEEDEMIAADVGIDGGAASAEEAAVHVVQDDDSDDLDE